MGCGGVNRGEWVCYYLVASSMADNGVGVRAFNDCETWWCVLRETFGEYDVVGNCPYTKSGGARRGRFGWRGDPNETRRVERSIEEKSSNKLRKYLV